ncbi:monovalent cation:proton antiporter family protein [Marinigracilibium pacificum]|uniref:Potassium transporter KefB n=1 Tax=Marinigracilibium pacificum TaxID=2729599 RepID=A0A848J1T0_9BACT|nr:monovalent cation:proton antiporter family protein [Marinigracilibium pacificum]NMM48269.1 potassium transporter KefB [Marinigracilibium pacificum]
MHTPAILIDILYLLGISVIVVSLFHKINVPTIIGFLISGIVIGPYGLTLVAANEEVEMLAEIGVILLLFVIGLEFSLKQLALIKKTVLLGGGLQVGLTILFTTGIIYILVKDWSLAVFIGFLFSLSSSAIVFKMLQDRDEMDTPHGRFSLGVLIFQDIIVVPMMLLTPILAGKSDNILGSISTLALKTVIIIIFTLFAARYLVPKLLHSVAKTRSNELFIFTTLTICLGVAVGTAEVGLSLAFGAFIAGLVISESDYSHRAVSLVLPFRELFTGFFFISIGMLLDLSFLLKNIIIIVPVLILVFVIKTTIASIAAILLKYPLRSSIIGGLSLFQVGEFSFILSQVGIDNNLLSAELNQYFLSVSIISMICTPFIMINSERISQYLVKRKKQRKNIYKETASDTLLHDHIIIIGYGLNGKNVAHASKIANVPYIIIEFNPDTVILEKEKGENIIYGDASNDFILHKAGIEKARVAIIAISDSAAIKGIISSIRSHSASIHIIVRTRFVKDIDTLLLTGADEVVPEEFETSIELFTRALHRYLIPIQRLKQLAHSFRSDNYNALTKDNTSKVIRPLNIPDINIEAITIIRESGGYINKPIKDTDIREKYKINILGINRNNIFITADPEEYLKPNDVIYVSGNSTNISHFIKDVT